MVFPAMPRTARLAVLGLLLSAVGGLGLVALASAHERPRDALDGPPSVPAGGGWGRGPGMDGWMAGPPLDRLLDDVNAGATQREQVRKILGGLRDDLASQREARRADQDRMRALFTAPRADAAAVEALRQQAAARQDAGARRVSEAMVAAANVLSVEQRQQVLERMKRRPEHGGRPPAEARPDGPGARAPRRRRAAPDRRAPA